MIIICTKITKIINWTTLDYTGWELFQMEPPCKHGLDGKVYKSCSADSLSDDASPPLHGLETIIR